MTNKKSLKDRLYEVLKTNGSINLAELESMCHKWGYKQATAERILRPSISPSVTPLIRKGAIVGYSWNGMTKEQKDNVWDFMKTWGTKPKEEKPKGLF